MLFILFTLLFKAHCSFKGVVNLQPIEKKNSLSLKIVSTTQETLKLVVTHKNNSFTYSITPHTLLHEEIIELPASMKKLNELNIELFHQKNKILFPYFFIASPLSEKRRERKASFGTRFGKEYRIPKGLYKVNEHFVIESEVTTIDKGASFVFSNESSLTIKGGVKFEGSQEAPITFKGEGLQSDFFIKIIQKENQHSTLQHLKIQDSLRPLSKLPTGTLTLYGGSFKVSHLEMSNISTEDALNSVKSKIEITNAHFSHVQSDAIDFDFCQASLRSIHIAHAGGDGVDISGSELEATKISTTHISDKSFSIGENSRFKAKDLTLKKSDIGVAIKDGSIASVSNIKIENTRLHFSLYNKKRWFTSPPLLTIDSKPDNSQIDLKDGAKIEVRP